MKSTGAGEPSRCDHSDIAGLQQRVEAELTRYEHPLLRFGTRLNSGRLWLIIDVLNPARPVHQYTAELHPRDLENAQFSWTFQRILYDCLHDYFIEMFIRTPQDRK